LCALNGQTLTSVANSSNNHTLQCYIISKEGREGYTRCAEIIFLISQTWATRWENGGESSNSLKVLTYVERVLNNLLPPSFLCPTKRIPRI